MHTCKLDKAKQLRLKTTFFSREQDLNPVMFCILDVYMYIHTNLS